MTILLKSTILILLMLLISCAKEDLSSEEVKNMIDNIENSEQDSANVKEDICSRYLQEIDSIPEIKYELIAIDDAKKLTEVKSRFRKDSANHAEYKSFTTLNRKEISLLKVGDTVIVPDKYLEDMRAYSVFPRFYCDAVHLPKLIVVSNPMQAYACYEYGRLIRFAATNTGKETTPTYPGRYALEWKQRLRRSSLDSTWILPFTWNFHRQAGNAFHQFSMPGRAVSHSCARQFLDDAEWLYYWGSGAKYDSLKKPIPMTGTPVIMLGMFDYDRKKGGPWLDVKTNKQGIIELLGNPMEIEEAVIPLSQIPKVSRNSLRNYQSYLYGEDTLRARGIIREHITLIPSIDYNAKRRKEKKRKAEEKLRLEQEKRDVETTAPNFDGTPKSEPIREEDEIFLRLKELNQSYEQINGSDLKLKQNVNNNEIDF